MKILLLANKDYVLYKFRKELLEVLIDKLNEVTIVLPSSDSLEELKKMGCKCYTVEMERRGITPFKDLKLIIQYLKIINNIKPNVVLTYTIKPNVYGGIACSLCKIPYIANVTGLGTSIENNGLLQKIAIFLYKIGLKKARCVFFQNKANSDFFLKRVLKKNCNSKIIPGSGVNLQDNGYEKYPSEADGLRFIFIGRIMKDKGIEELFEAAKKIKQKHFNCKFSIIGEGEEDYSNQIKELCSRGVIEYFGYQKDVHPFIKNSHCLILPSYHEGTANVLLESAACGRPVIATRVAGCQETFIDGVTGLGCEVKNAEDLLSKIEKFISMSEKEHEAMGKAGRDKMEKEYDRQFVTQAYLNEIDKIV